MAPATLRVDLDGPLHLACQRYLHWSGRSAATGIGWARLQQFLRAMNVHCSKV
jgi:hypothetical protein